MRNPEYSAYLQILIFVQALAEKWRTATCASKGVEPPNPTKKIGPHFDQLLDLAIIF